MDASYLSNIVNLTEICARLGVETAVLSSGSRNAPLMIAFNRQPDIKTYVVMDERAAAFIALGIAQQTQKPVALICTSGTAGLNYSPALAEAYYQQIPLIVLTADRPAEWLEQQDGQTIIQEGVYRNYVKKSYTLPINDNHPDAIWHCGRNVAEAINFAMTEPKAPIHINVPIREPFYPSSEQQISFNPVKVIRHLQAQPCLNQDQWQTLLDALRTKRKILIVAGQQFLNATQLEALERLNIPVVADITANLHSLNGVIGHSDIFLNAVDENTKQLLQPELLISFGLSILAKNLKLYLRSYKPFEHWHIQAAGEAADTYQALTQVIRLQPEDFFNQLRQHGFQQPADSAYLQSWQWQENRTLSSLNDFFAKPQAFNEFLAVKTVLDDLPKSCGLHLGNSMSVRYANFVGLVPSGLKDLTGLKVYANRGTSGIDGCMSTAVGHSLENSALQTLLIGDLSFFYDRNALWHSHLPNNLRIVLLNNHGGGIFEILPAPKQLPEFERFFKTPHSLNAKNTAQDFGLDYDLVDNEAQLKKCLKTFFKPGEAAKLLEINIDSAINSETFKQFKNNITFN